LVQIDINPALPERAAFLAAGRPVADGLIEGAARWLPVN